MEGWVLYYIKYREIGHVGGTVSCTDDIIKQKKKKNPIRLLVL